jgi:hypothetical protein
MTETNQPVNGSCSKVTPDGVAPTQRDKIEELEYTLIHLQNEITHGVVPECLLAITLGWDNLEYQKLRDVAIRDRRIFSPRPRFLGCTHPDILGDVRGGTET